MADSPSACPWIRESVTAFFRLGAARLDRPVNLAEAQALLKANGLGQILLAAPLEEDGGRRAQSGVPGTGDDALAVEFAPLLKVYQSMYDTVSANNVAVNGGGGVNRDQARSAGLQLVGLGRPGRAGRDAVHAVPGLRQLHDRPFRARGGAVDDAGAHTRLVTRSAGRSGGRGPAARHRQGLHSGRRSSSRRASWTPKSVA